MENNLCEWTEEKTLLVPSQLLMAAGPLPVGRQQEQPRPLLPQEMSPSTAPRDSQQGEVTLHNTPFLQVKIRHKSQSHWACQASALLHHSESQGRCQTWGAVGPQVLRAPRFLETAGIIAPSPKTSGHPQASQHLDQATRSDKSFAAISGS